MAQVKLSILVPTVVGREAEYLLLAKSIVGGLFFTPHFKENVVLGEAELTIEKIRWIFCGDATYDELKTDNLSSKFPTVEFISIKDDKQIPIGQKRELLYGQASGEYSLQVDDDDSLAPDAIEKILAAIDATNPDCVTFRERCDMNGKIQTCNHSLKYDKWGDNWDGFDFVRTPFYKDVIKTEIARSVPFPYIRYNEDEQWSMALKPHLSTESHIDEELYYYSYYPKESHEERYGLNKS